MLKKLSIIIGLLALLVPAMMVLAQDDTTCTAFASGSNAERTSYYMGEGAAFMQSGNYAPAIRSYTCIVEEIDSSYDDAYYNRAAAYSARREFNLAIDDYTSVIAGDSTYIDAYNNRGIIYAAQGEFNLALDDFDSALSIDNEYLRAITNRGVIHVIMEDLQSAEADFRTVIDLADLEAVIADLRDPDRDPETPRPAYNRDAVQAYALLGIIESQRAAEAYDSYLFLIGNRADSRIRSAAGALESRFEFELRLDDGSWFLLANLADS